MSDQAQPHCSNCNHDVVSGHLKVTHQFEMLDKNTLLTEMNSKLTENEF